MTQLKKKKKNIMFILCSATTAYFKEEKHLN